MRLNHAHGIPPGPQVAGTMARRRQTTAALTLACILLPGCDWLAQPGVDARREGNYQDGLRWKEQGRTLQARESFYRALDVNPHNYHAHLQLGDLYRSDGSNQVRSVYHYERYKELASRQAEGGRFRDQSADDGIRNAKVELARQYANTLLNDQRVAELEAIRRTNSLLTQQFNLLQHQNALLSRQVASLTNSLYAAPTPAATPPPVAFVAQERTPQPHAPAPQASPAQGPSTPKAATPTPASRTHRVAARETFSSIAAQYGVRPAALQAANPRVDARRLKPGQVLVIPQK